MIDTVEALGIDAADAAPDYWRHVHNRLSAGEAPRSLHRCAPPGLAPASADRAMTACNSMLVIMLAQRWRPGARLRR